MIFEQLIVTTLIAAFGAIAGIRYLRDRRNRRRDQLTLRTLRSILEEKRADRRAQLEDWDREYARLERGGPALTTEEAMRDVVRAAQAAGNVVVDGVVGPITRGVFYEAYRAGIITRQEWSEVEFGP